MGSSGQLLLIEKKLSKLKTTLIQNGISKDILEEVQGHINNINNYLYYMSDIISTTKNQAKASTNLSESVFSLRELFQRASLILSHELKKRKVSLHLQLDEVMSDYKLHGDLISLIQVFVNLIENAIDAYNGKSGDIKIGAKKEIKYIRIFVKDNGCGMSYQVKNKVLKQMITTKGTNGTGIGLYISNIIIKAKFGGYLDIESELNKGTTLSILLPID